MWEPAAGAAGIGAQLVADGDTVWFTYKQPCTSGNCTKAWLVHTSADGEQLQAPVVIYDDPFAEAPVLAITDTMVVVTYARDGVPMVRRYDRAGTPLDATAQPISSSYAGGAVTVTELALTANVGDSTWLAFTPLEQTFPGAVAVVEVDAQGRARGDVVPLGTREEGWSRAAISAMGDGATLVGWAHGYDDCSPPYRTAFTLTAPVASDGSVGPLAPVRDLPERDERLQSLASAGGTSYVAWTGDVYAGVSLARYPQLDDVGLFAIPGVPNHMPFVALAGADRGAVVWKADDEANGSIVVAPFSSRDGHIAAGEPRVLPRLGEPTSRSPTGIAHVGGARYVVAWSEGASDARELYAMQIDFDMPSAATTPASSIVPSAQTPAPPTRPLRCTH